MKDELLTIKEFAEAAGVSSQAVYQRLSKSLQGYVVEVNGKKHLKKDALSLFDVAEPKVETKQVEQESTNIEQDLLKALQGTIAVLQEQLKTKDEQIADLNARLKDALEISKGQVLISAAEHQQLPPIQDELTEELAVDPRETKPTIWHRFKSWWT